jgi:hypothetical protein
MDSDPHPTPEGWGRHGPFLLIKDEGPVQSWALCPATFELAAWNRRLAELNDFTVVPVPLTRRERFVFWRIEWGYRLRGAWKALRGDY